MTKEKKKNTIKSFYYRIAIITIAYVITSCPIVLAFQWHTIHMIGCHAIYIPKYQVILAACVRKKYKTNKDANGIFHIVVAHIFVQIFSTLQIL